MLYLKVPHLNFMCTFSSYIVCGMFCFVRVTAYVIFLWTVGRQSNITLDIFQLLFIWMLT